MSEYRAFCNGSFRAQSPVTSQTACINFYTEITPDGVGGVSQYSLYPTPGVQAFTTVLTGLGGRAMFDTGAGRTFSIIADLLVEVFADGSTITRASGLAQDLNPATITTNGDGGHQLFITSGDHGYCYDLLANTNTEVLTDGATQGGMLYGYFVAFDKGRSQIRISDLFDGSVWDPTQFAANSISSDNWQAMCVTAFAQICLVGSKTGQFWYNSGAFPFPFAPDPSALFQTGIAATFSIKEVNNGVSWLSTTAQGGYAVVFASGYQPGRISDHALEFSIDNFPTVADCIGDAYDDEGHVFLILSFPSADTTWAFDFSTKQWAQRGTWISEDNAFTYWRPVFHCFSFNKHLMADRESGVIYEMAHGFGLDVDGREIRRVRRAPAINNEHLKLRYAKLELLVESGLGTSTGAGVDPQIMFRQSPDFGQTWGNETQMSLGKIGEYSWRVIQRKLGQARGKVFEISTTAITPVRITDAYLQVLPSSEPT